MPSMPEVIAKPPILKNLDALSQNATKLKALRSDLESSIKDVATVGSEHGILKTVDEVLHIRNDWCFAWWPQAQPVEPILRKGLITAIDVAIREPGAESDRAEPLPLDGYWVCHPGHPIQHTAQETPGTEGVEVSVTWNARQVTIIFHTPETPYGDDTLTGKELIYVAKRDRTTGQIIVTRP